MRFEKVIAFVNQQKPDILGMSELNGWADNDFQKLEEFSKKTNLKNHSFALTNSGFHLALFSNESITSSEIEVDNFTHGLIQASVGSLTLYLTHLDYGTEEGRLREADLIINLMKDTSNNILMGDLNSLSPLDTYDEDRLLKHFKQIGLKKFGEKHLRRDVQKKLLASGLIDTARELSDSVKHSVPTSSNTDPAHAAKLRLDYIYISKDLKANLKNAAIIRNEFTNQLSDHFPVFIDLDV